MPLVPRVSWAPLQFLRLNYSFGFFPIAFTSYGAFWMSYATILLPGSGIISAFTDPTELNSALGIYLIAWFMVTFFLLWVDSYSVMFRNLKSLPVQPCHTEEEHWSSCAFCLPGHHFPPPRYWHIHSRRIVRRSLILRWPFLTWLALQSWQSWWCHGRHHCLRRLLCWFGRAAGSRWLLLTPWKTQLKILDSLLSLLSVHENCRVWVSIIGFLLIVWATLLYDVYYVYPSFLPICCIS